MRTLDEGTDEVGFYVSAIRLLRAAEIPFLVGGAYGLRHYTGVVRDTKDFDIFIRPSDLDRTLSAFRKAGYRGEVAFAHWLAKVHYGENFIDIIFRAGNGLCEVDEVWFEASRSAELLGEQVALVPPEEMIWQKAYIMERERFDGADVAHLLRSCTESLDWERLLRRFGEDWRVLASHLVLFSFIYPGERERIPASVMDEILKRMRTQSSAPKSNDSACQGTLLSRAQYLPDIERWNYEDARIKRSRMTAQEIEEWTNAIGRERAWA